MRPVRDGVYIRPLLDIPRGVILAWLEEQGQPYRTDASNETDRFTRNRIRRRLLPSVKGMEPSH
jgi:tRNA(Ile)-lysidine synthase